MKSTLAIAMLGAFSVFFQKMHQATLSLEAHSAHKGPTPLSRHPAGGAAPPGITTPPFQLPLTALLTFLHVFNLTSTTKQPLPKHYQAHPGNYQAITKPTRAITKPLSSTNLDITKPTMDITKLPLAITKHSLAITKPPLATTKPEPSPHLPLPSYDQAPAGHYQASTKPILAITKLLWANTKPLPSPL